jgi:predicted nucleotidyltransferase
LKKKINLIKDHIIERVSPYIIYVFGSAAKGKMVEDSDIDVAFKATGLSGITKCL